jgi:hypothetical protein
MPPTNISGAQLFSNAMPNSLFREDHDGDQYTRGHTHAQLAEKAVKVSEPEVSQNENYAQVAQANQEVLGRQGGVFVRVQNDLANESGKKATYQRYPANQAAFVAGAFAIFEHQISFSKIYRTESRLMRELYRRCIKKSTPTCGKHFSWGVLL